MGRAWKLLAAVLGSRAVATRLLWIWVGVMGFVGCELSWLFSPFLCEPTAAPHVIPKLYTRTNFYEYVWAALGDVGRGR